MNFIVGPSIIPDNDPNRNTPRNSTSEEITGDLFRFGISYPALPGHKGGETSAQAAEVMAIRAPGIRGRLAREMAGIYPAGLTPDEAARSLDLTPFAIRPRFTELSAAGLIEKTGERRENPISGLKANVYRATNLLLDEKQLAGKQLAEKEFPSLLFKGEIR
jgi:hypothetical protein